MSKLCQGQFGPRLLKLLQDRKKNYLLVSSLNNNNNTTSSLLSRPYSQLAPTKLTINQSFLIRHTQRPDFQFHNRRNLGWIPAAVRGVLRIRYLLLGGALGRDNNASKDKKAAKIFKATIWGCPWPMVIWGVLSLIQNPLHVSNLCSQSLLVTEE